MENTMTVQWKSKVGICMAHPPLKKYPETNGEGHAIGFEMRFAWEDDCHYCGKEWSEH